MKQEVKNILEEAKKVLNEVTKVNYKGHTFLVKVDVNEDPTKKGIKLQFLPKTFGSLSPTQQDDIAIDIQNRLEQELSKVGIQLERDRELKDKTIIGFFIPIEYVSRIIRTALGNAERQM